jgi:predicted enzyme related to lactoylglutathione lyase
MQGRQDTSHMVAGLVSPPGAENAPPYWAAYINSVDIPADVAKAKPAGATILVEHMEVPNAGTLAVIQDPQGAVFSLWKANDNAG